MAYLFEPDVLAQIVRMHLALPIEQQIDAVGRTLREVYGQHVTPGQRWMWSNAGGIMCAIPLTRNIGLLFLGPVILNITAYHAFVDKGSLAMPAVFCAISAYLLWSARAKFTALLNR